MAEKVQVIMYKDTYTGKTYKTLREAEKAERKYECLLVLREFAKKNGFVDKKSLKIKRSAESFFLQWLDDKNYDKWISSNQTNKEQAVYYAIKNISKSWDTYTPECLKTDLEIAVKILTTEASNSEQVVNKTVKEKYNILIDLNVKEWDVFRNELIELQLNNISLIDEEIYTALDVYGVDNWYGYEDAIKLSKESGKDWFDLSSEEKLSYLKDAGVDNWPVYEDAIYEYKVEHKVDLNKVKVSEEDFVKLFEEIKNKNSWKNYSKYKELIY